MVKKSALLEHVHPLVKWNVQIAPELMGIDFTSVPVNLCLAADSNTKPP
jgi:hypothetical protein